MSRCCSRDPYWWIRWFPVPITLIQRYGVWSRGRRGGGRKDKSTLDVFGGGYIRETDWGLAIWVVDHWLMKFHFSAVWLLLLPAFWDFWLSHMTYIESKCTPSMILGHLDNVQPLSQNALPWEIYHTQVFDASALMRNARLGWARYL